MAVIEKIGEFTIYESPKSQQPPLHARFPGVVQLPSGQLMAMFQLSEVIDETIAHMYISRSSDLGQTWQFEGEMYDTEKAGVDFQFDESFKPLILADGRLMAFGYRYNRPDLDVPIVNPETGGFLWGPNIVSFSKDDGKTWTLPETVDCGITEGIETSGPAIKTQLGDIIAIGPPFPMWDGTNPTGHQGIVIRSKDNGKSWDGSARYYVDKINGTVPFESRISQMQDGRLVAIVWAYNMQENKNYDNHVTVSHDNGYTWSDPIDAGHTAQASNLMPIKDNLLLTIHSHRAGENIGLYVRIIDFTDDVWNMLEEKVIWGEVKAQSDPKSVADQMAGLQFGQPSLLELDNGEILAYHWAKIDGQANIIAHRLKLNL